jgi:sigma-B regulation protein RsbU (phosphoserine phosphatase)
MVTPRANRTSMKSLLFLPDDSSRPLSRLDVFRLKNWMLFGNFLANVVAFVLMEKLIFRGGPLPSNETRQIVASSGDIFRGCATIAIALFIFYEVPIRRYLNNIHQHLPTSQEVVETARRRLLNEPFYMMALNLGIWLVAAFFFSYRINSLGEPRPVVLRMFLLSLNTGLITAVMSFFLLEHVSQGHVARFFFPEGGLHKTPKTIRNRIVVRLLALLFACNTIPFLSFIQLYYLTAPGLHYSGDTLQDFRSAVFTNSIFFIVVGFIITMFVHMNFDAPLREIIQALKDIRRGNFDRKVPVRSNDEIGYTGDVINGMTKGLKERDRMRHSLLLAKEIQQNLLPGREPHIDGLDISGRSIYCDETGGDYYDFLDTAKPGERKICVVVGDVSDHGIPSALLMTTARAFLRQRMSRAGDLNRIVSDVNRQLARDVEESGQFMTLFLCEIDVDNQWVRWVRAGHDPALIYDLETDSFDELGGRGLALGVFEDSKYQTLTREIKPRQIIAIGTDGIWETTNIQGQQFGKERFKNVIQANASESAVEILTRVINEVDDFTGQSEKSDDVTLVIIKVEVQ